MAPRISKWPFFLGDALLLGLAYFLFAQSRLPMGNWEILGCVLCVALGAGFSVLPFLLEYRAAVKLAEAEGLASVVSQIQDLKLLADQIRSATGLWQTAQEAADATASTAKSIADRMAAEVKGFNEFMQRFNEDEKAALRLEVDKLRRAEAEWLQVLVRTLDHVFALHRAALRSQQPSLIEQLGHFQNACRDAARRVGLAPFVAAPDEPFDGQRHQLAEGDSKPPADSAVEETIATGYTFQGRLVRPALVRVRNGKGGPTASEPVRATPDEAPDSGQSHLPLESAGAQSE